MIFIEIYQKERVDDKKNPKRQKFRDIPTIFARERKPPRSPDNGLLSAKTVL